ncbi:hypothetical protein QBC38DRAFT_16449 [Podospora fimiseda]|uniref:WD repeat-containing protein n=1 Tax=Podospora fimiseda TaxID=252190 RepID=A0AAN7BJD1_9PEZI|nr:hypothetical protein QBC38DRAFT_16449 [Podospora fimiseda]
MTSLWSSVIKGVTSITDNQHRSNTGDNKTQSLPRSTSISADVPGTRTRPPLTSSQPPNPSRKSLSKTSRSQTVAQLKEKDRDKEKDTDGQKNADSSRNPTTTVAGNGSAIGLSIGVSQNQSTVSPIPSPSIDPLTQQIYMRRNTEHSISIPRRSIHMAEGIARTSSDFLTRATAPTSDASKDKKKGGSFLSRLSMRGGRKKQLGDFDSDSEFGLETRMDGINARVFSQTLNSPLIGGGFVPHHKEPPRYIRTKATNKKEREFNRMFLAQELVGTRPPEDSVEAAAEASKAPVVTVSVAGGSDHKTARSGGAIWATEFSKDGKYLATGGRDHVVRIWAVISTPEERRANEEEEAANRGAGERLSAPVFRDQPVMEFEGHAGEVLDLSWSKNNFLLSSSMDKTVRLWHLSRKECLCTFKHKDFVTRLAFHPRDDRFFLAGSLDSMLRLWSIPDKAVAYSAQLPDLVTAVAFTPDGKMSIAGLLNGLCVFFETEGLKQLTQIHVRSSRGKNAKGSKITGIQTMVLPPQNSSGAPTHVPPPSNASHVSDLENSSGEVRVLVTSNDSRIRIYSIRDNSLDIKLKGHENSCSQIAATFSDDGKYVICGSEDRKAFVWNLTNNNAISTDKDKSPCEYFEAHGEVVTTALFAPTRSRMLLGQSGDPIYDLCNPPPVVLQSLEEVASAAVSQVALSTNGSHVPPASESMAKKPEPSPAYIARSTHYDGNIIITTGDTGIIKVFRQDCAFAKRRHDSWETGSTFSRKLGPGNGFVSSGLGRSGSVVTRTSGGSTAHSRRGSVSMVGNIGSPQLGVNSDRILSWRQGIEHGNDKRSSLLGNGSLTASSERSVSPAKTNGTPLSSMVNLASEARKQPYANSSATRNRAGSTLTSPTASVFNGTPERIPSRLLKAGRERRKSRADDEISVPPTPSFTFRSASENEEPIDSTAGGGGGGGSTTSSFWNLNRWRGITAFNKSTNHAVKADGPGSSGSRSSLAAKQNGNATTAGDEKDAPDQKENDAFDGTRRRSIALGVFTTISSDGNNNNNSGVADRHKSMPPPAGLAPALSIRGMGGDSDIRSIPVSAPGDHEHAVPSTPFNPVQARRDGSPYRHLWSRGTEADGGVMKCAGCGGKEFKAKKVGGKQVLSCGKCGEGIDE